VSRLSDSLANGMAERMAQKREAVGFTAASGRTPKAFEAGQVTTLERAESSHPARSGGSDVWDLRAVDRASLHHYR